MTYREGDEERQAEADREREQEQAEALRLRAEEDKELQRELRRLRLPVLGGSSGMSLWCGVTSVVALGAGLASCGFNAPGIGAVLVLFAVPIFGLLGVLTGLFAKGGARARVVGLITSCVSLLTSGYWWWAITHMSFTSGRPFRAAGRKLRAGTRRDDASDWIQDVAIDASRLDPELRARLAVSWVEEARAEHASIAAFSRLALDLLSVGAPSALVDATQRAALDEIRHARVCLGIARAYSCDAMSFLPSAAFASPHELATFDRLARESLVDGCLHEGFAAELLRERASRAGPGVLRQTIAAIAEDETRHAELAWEILEFCASAGGDQTRDAIARAARDLQSEAPPRALPADILGQGQVDPRRTREIWRDCVRRVVARCEKHGHIRSLLTNAIHQAAE